MKEPSNPYLLFVGIGIELVGIEIAMIYVGFQLDQKFGWPGVGVAFLSLGGLVLWLYHVVRLLRRVESKNE